jgi:N-acetylneuraminic acid mutarotase
MCNTDTYKRTVKFRFLAGKSTILLFAILLAAGLTTSRAQDTWTQKADFGGHVRYYAVGFSIGSKGYIGTGYDAGCCDLNDLWEYDPATDVWIQKADFGGAARNRAAGFSIGTKGYIGTGFDEESPYSQRNDFWEYDPATNTWTQKADFGGTARSSAVGFSIANKGYIGTGFDVDSPRNDFWEYDPDIDTWIQKADFGGTARYAAVGFSIGTKGYIGTGSNYDYKNDFWEYDPATDTWTQRSNFGGTARFSAVGFFIDNKGYIGQGQIQDYPQLTNDFWEYDPVTDEWTQKTDFGGDKESGGLGFSIGSKGFMTDNLAFDFWEYTPLCNGLTIYADVDGDDYGDADNSILIAECIAPVGYAYNSTDCNDGNASIHPGACDAANGNGIDDNCDGAIDNGYGVTTYYSDADGDGYGIENGTSLCSNPGAGYSLIGGDCDDADAAIHPGACDASNGNAIDDNCDGIVDDNNGTTAYYTDADGDFYGAGNATYLCTNPGTGYSTNNTDCNDANASIHPGAIETINGIDDNCNGTIDENACPLPANLSVSNITGTSATLNWEEGSFSFGYKIRYKVSTTGPWKHAHASGTSLTIFGLTSNTKYTWQVKSFCDTDPFLFSDWSEKQKFVTGALRIGDGLFPPASFQIYPNPATNHATVQFILVQPLHVFITVYDVSGREMETLMDKDVEQGAYSLQINTEHFSKGVYFVKMTTDFGISNQKLIVQ